MLYLLSYFRHGKALISRIISFGKTFLVGCDLDFI
ncbi:hypothetical protein KL86DES1_20088 [uncultured Desulfovibrio sp.]|uniref:Uncharacterized protein n=1 Tax=uncultured Desulfovibrio sp. TaxID=167968 RepID=A0A212L290_9BACT|nr:hypothetical protein KL86DES1_20088 [uncultured Desulfovibrio sp.]VZH32988.1 conserved protein of unknown function [Desulfovibrio sp. 86]